MIIFDFNQFLIDKRLSVQDVAKKVGLDDATLYRNKQSGRIKPRTLKILEDHYGPLETYVHKIVYVA